MDYKEQIPIYLNGKNYWVDLDAYCAQLVKDNPGLDVQALMAAVMKACRGTVNPATVRAELEKRLLPKSPQ